MGSMIHLRAEAALTSLWGFDRQRAEDEISEQRRFGVPAYLIWKWLREYLGEIGREDLLW